MVEIDGRKWDVSIEAVGLDTEFLYKYAERNEAFDMIYELGAIFLNQSLTFGQGKSGTDFAELWNYLSSRSTVDGGTGHNVKIWTPIGKLSFIMYPDKLHIDLVHIKGDEDDADSWWSGLKITFTALKPARK